MAADRRPPDGAAICISVHDVAPSTWPECRTLLDLLDGVGAGPLTLLVVPDFHGGGRIDRTPAFCRELERRLARGDELALHGYRHLDDAPPPAALGDWIRRRLLTAGEAEFAALDEAEAGALLARGIALFERLGWPLHGFVAPAWQLGAGARAALCGSGFRYTTTRRAIWRLPDWRRTDATSLVYSSRSASRRWLSARWNDNLEARLRRAALVRLSLHPADARYPAVLRHWRGLIERAGRQRQAMTKVAWVARQL